MSSPFLPLLTYRSSLLPRVLLSLATAPRVSARQSLYDRYLHQLAVDGCPIEVVDFLFVNKPAEIERRVGQWNVRVGMRVEGMKERVEEWGMMDGMMDGRSGEKSTSGGESNLKSNFSSTMNYVKSKFEISERLLLANGIQSVKKEKNQTMSDEKLATEITKLYEKVLTEVNEIVGSMKAENNLPDAITYLFLIDLHLMGNNTLAAVAVLNEMKLLNLIPFRSHYSKVIIALANQDKMGEAENWLKELTSAVPDPYDLSICKALQKMYERANMKSKVDELSKVISEKLSSRTATVGEQASGVQWSFPRKPVTSTGAADSKKAAPKGVNAPKKNAKK